MMCVHYTWTINHHVSRILGCFVTMRVFWECSGHDLQLDVAELCACYMLCGALHGNAAVIIFLAVETTY